ncbi:LuxR C-terminal-related transcriptional regulator [Nocardioides sambongensis]|uniref:LuxR C-terminal-related transcriptional regulator n=1 Tax=Nocardioides sambongensis TaxID=2589074 RepID=UPI001129C870|nr:LuxR C-terminal-related transcriptional regulator [Nocardioides sambongensis]
MGTATTVSPGAVLDRGLADTLRLTGVPVGFAGLVHPDQQRFQITTLRGTLTNSLSNLTVRAGEGLGGKALALLRPATVSDYHSARGITRRYDHAVSPERLRSIICMPVALPGRPPLAVLYLAERDLADFGNVISERLRPAVSRLAHDLSVELEMQRRAVDAEPGPGLDPAVRAELAALMSATTDEATREGLARLLGEGRPEPADDCPLTPRELQVVGGAADGASNAEIGVALGLTEGTVKSYLKAAMAKLEAKNRVQAGLIARRRGYLA